MDTSSVVRTFDFPLQISQAEIQYLGVRESFTWGPQALWLLSGLIWIFYFLVRDIPELARNTLLFGAGVSLLAALGAGYEMRRRNRQAVLYPLGGRTGLYRGSRYQYSFVPAQMFRMRLDFFGWIVVMCKLLLPMLLLMVILGVVMFDGMKQSGPHPWQDMTLFIYAMLFALFGFVAFYRSHIRLAFFWIPNGKGKTDRLLYLHPRELHKIDDGDGRAIR
ncbi:MAG TPA: hypothetical protein VFR24_03535 [Candidatus Angelobacter sp.]|nr:hypothetical protein [Candidatus Angelobacter sp.]